MDCQRCRATAASPEIDGRKRRKTLTNKSERRPVALVTGATSGLGREFARILAQNSFDLVLTARNRTALEKLASELFERYQTESLIFPADLSQPNAPVDLCERVRASGLEIEILINNAGFGTFGHFAESDLGTQLAMIQVNIAALTHLAGLFLPRMIERGCGRILNVSSTAAFQAGPTMAVYYASKGYILRFSEALAVETKGTGVTVTAFCPGLTYTDFHRRAGMEDTYLIRYGRRADARSVALIGFRGMMKGKTLVIPGLLNKLGVLAVKLLPHSLIRPIVGFLHKKSR